MARWAYVAAPVGAALLIGAWWATDQALGTPDPDLGPAITVSPHPGPTATTPPATNPPATNPPSGPVQTVPPAPPPDAGDEDPDDDDDDAGDDDAD